MTNILMMLLAFTILSAVALGFHTILRVNMGEGMVLSTSLIVVLLFFSSFAGTFSYGMIAIYIAATAGAALWLVASFRRLERGWTLVFSVTFMILLLLYLGCLVLYYNDYIQHIDEFHEWAAAVRYMLLFDKMPLGYDFIGGSGQYGFATSLFHLFFQKIAGYSEQNMYVSAALLTWIGFMLPFSGYGWKQWKKAAVYVVLVYLSLYTLYMYGSKNLYVDIPTAAWAGGLAGWWLHREKRSNNLPVLAVGLVMLHFFKQSAGLLIAVFVLLFVLFQTFVVEKGYLERKNGIRRLAAWTGVLCGLVVLGSAAFLVFGAGVKPYQAAVTEKAAAESTVTEDAAGAEMAETGTQPFETEPLQRWTFAGHVLPDVISARLSAAKVSKEKTVLSLGAFMTSVFGTPLASKSNWNMAFLPFLVGLLVLMKAGGELYGQRRECAGYIFYMLFMTLSYLAVLFFSYLFMFAYELSVEMRSVNRYFSICGVFLFVLVLSILLQPQQAQKETAKEFLVYGLVFFFALGLNKKFIPNNTALQKTEVSSYDEIIDIRKQVNKIREQISGTEVVYFINQFDSDSLGDAEITNASALYYMDNHLGNYLGLPWRFTEKGCNIRLENFDTLSVKDLPYLLWRNGFSYVWIHRTDKYLNEELPQVMDCDAVESETLYRIRYEDNAAAGLEFVCSLRK